ncbi:hypothetical protein QNO07_22485 [Streptomyces sp. 549]|uniref:hypothetical protein n=1 Tax=Streptomyces sp. 549 TaxID=3049076 RepID=UPI0024C2E8D8|nr:hypothetical protein [Streptomyces sp. 549]MDK1476152.1 hypothetical protein [Streptomyces sp. 549]
MWLRVYRLRPDGSRVTVVRTTTRPTRDGRLPLTLAWPPCACPRCRKQPPGAD